MKITITSLHLRHGGVEKVIASLSNMLTDMGHEVEILCTYNLGEPVYPINTSVKITYLTPYHPNRDEFYDAVARKNPFKIIKEGIYGVVALRAKDKTMRKALKNINAGMVISTRNDHTVMLSQYGQESVYKVAQLHHDHLFDEKLINDFKYNYTNIDQFLLLTQGLADEVSEMMKGTNSKTICSWMPNFLDNDLIQNNLPKKKQVISAGRLHPDKGFDRLIDIWKIVRDANPDYELIIAGEGDLEKTLKQQVSSLNLSDSVHFVGTLDHPTLMAKMSESLAYAMTSITEGFALVLVEGMSQGTIPVAFDVRVGPRAIIDDQIDGFLVEDGDLQAFANKIQVLIDDERLRQKMETAAKIKSETFSQKVIQKKWQNIIDTAMEEL